MSDRKVAERPASAGPEAGGSGPRWQDPVPWFAVAGLCAAGALLSIHALIIMAFASMDMGANAGGGGRGLLVVAAVFVLGTVGTGIQGIRLWRRLGHDTGFANVSVTAGALGLASTRIWFGTRPALVLATVAIATGLAAIVGARRGRAGGYGRAVTGVGLGLSTYVLVAILFGVTWLVYR
jgi:hypothetical protein